MKNNYSLIEVLLMMLVSMSLFSQNYSYLSDYDSQGVPLDMVNTSVSVSLVDNIGASLPEGYPVPDFNPEYISDDVETSIVLNELADVWVTFVGEGAGYRNVLGFYTYDLSNPPLSPPADEDITIIFPNVSAAGSGGGLIVGDKMYLGQFPANTGIGWVLIANGWNGSNVTYGNWVLYSNPYWNPEGSSDLQKHNVNLYDNNEQVIVFGFEDIRRDFGSCDQDFNDALFLVTSNPYTAFETGNFNQITYDGGGQSSGNDGGLESNRGLSNKVAQRTYNRTKNSTPIAEQNVATTRTISELEAYVPQSIIENDIMVISSPTDLQSITKAEEVWSADYLTENKIFATVFSTMTNEGVYDHTKVVCDRLAGSMVIDVQDVVIDDHPMLLTTLQREDGNLEYSISISIEIINKEKFTVFSRWAVDQYPESGKFLNYQIWSSAPFLTKDIIKKIISNLKNEMDHIDEGESEEFTPDVFVQGGRYIDNAIECIVNNTTEEEQIVSLIGTTTRSEIDSEPLPYLEQVTVAPGMDTFRLSTNEESLFDIELKVRVEGADNYDVVYFSDGAWALDFDESKTVIENIDIEGARSISNENEFWIPRNIEVDFTSTDYLTVYKNLRPSGGSADVSMFNGMKINVTGNGFLEMKLIKSSIEDWDQQFYYTVKLEDDINELEIPFSYFRNELDEEFTAEDLKMITFTQKNFSGEASSLSLSDVRFTHLSDNLLSTNNKNNIGVFPNPSQGDSKVTFESEVDGEGSIKVCDSHGIKVLDQKIYFHKGLNIKSLNLETMEKGVFWLEIVGLGVPSIGQKIIVF